MHAQDNVVTQTYRLPWIPPVPTIDDLPRVNVAEGALCWVQDTEIRYVFINGAWHPVKRR